MNIFALDSDPVIAAEMCCDKHVVKMILESAQMLSSVKRVLDGREEEYFDKKMKTKFVLSDQEEEERVYRVGWLNHPSTQWVMKNKSHYVWLWKHFEALNKEFIKRYHNNDIQKSHSSYKILGNILKTPPRNIPDKPGFDLPTPAMPRECLIYDESNNILIVESYRNYYIMKKDFATWKSPAKIPYWYKVRTK